MAEHSPNAQHVSKEKSKRPQLSCNSCRTRKVKCDRVQPCTACSLHQIAEQCQYDLTESERHPILQAEALREKDKEIARLRLEVLALGGSCTRPDINGNDPESCKRRKAGISARGGKKPASIRQKKPPHHEAVDNLYFGAPSLSNVIQELADLTLRTQAASLSHSPPQSSSGITTQDPASFPFPTLWPAKDGVSSLLALIPHKDEVFSYLDSFQRRVQGCSFPHVPEECTRTETERFLSNAERNALLRPDMLALLFAAMAQGLQHGLYDRCGERWIAGRRTAESKKGDVFIAASVQALRQGSFMSRPTILVVEALVLIGPYLTDSGKLLDAWALFGITVRLAQAIGLHRDPGHLRPKPPPEELDTRKNLWWWILHMDQQYSVTLGRPLGISSIGDCPTPMMLRTDPMADSLSNYHSKFTILARQILSAGYLCNAQIDQFTEQLLLLQDTLPTSLHFNQAWLHSETTVPGWPLDAQAASLYQKTHNFIILLNRQRIEDNSMDSTCSSLEIMASAGTYHKARSGRERVLESCHEILCAFEFFHTRVRVGLVCWTICQQAFNAAHLLLTAIIEGGTGEHYPLVRRTYETFCELHRLGIHELAGAAVERIETMNNQLKSGCRPVDALMNKQGMALLEHMEQQNVDMGQFSPLNFNMVDAPKASDDHHEVPNTRGPDGPLSKPTKKHKPNTQNRNGQKHKSVLKKGQRKENVPQHRSAGGPWVHDSIQQVGLTNTFSTSATPIHTHHSSELSSIDIQSTLPSGSKGSPPRIPTDSSLSTSSTAPATTTSFELDDSKPWLYTSRSSPTASTLPPAVSSSVSAPSSYHQTSFVPKGPSVRLHNASSVTNSRPPSLHLSSHPSSTYANSFVSSLQSASGLHTPSASHPVSPSLSHNQQYCASQPQTQPQSPVWGVGFDSSMECTDLVMGISHGQGSCMEVGEGRTWWGNGWSG